MLLGVLGGIRMYSFFCVLGLSISDAGNCVQGEWIRQLGLWRELSESPLEGLTAVVIVQYLELVFKMFNIMNCSQAIFFILNSGSVS